MPELEDLVRELQELKPELTREAIDEQIRIKKEKIGAGYLTDQGAVFLIAADHGVSLGDPLKTDVGIKNLYAGAKEVSLETRVLSVSPARQFSRKDGTPFSLRTMTVYDSDGATTVKLWDEKAETDVVKGLKPGDLIRIIKAYVKSDRDGSAMLNVGSGSDIEVSDAESKIPPISPIVKDVSDVGEGDRNVAVSGIADGEISAMSFTNSRGNPGTALKMRLRGANGNVTRVVLWGKDDSMLPSSIPRDAKVTLFGVRAKQANAGLEVHGDDSASVRIEGGGEVGPLTVRILSAASADSGRRMIVAAGKGGELYNIADSAGMTAQLAEGGMAELMPSKVHGNSVTLDEKSYVKGVDDDGSFPGIGQAVTKVEDVRADAGCCIGAIVLKKPERREIQTKSGESVALSEMLVEDSTGQIWVKGWRGHARLVDGCSPGDLVTITGISARSGLEGRVEAVLTPFSKVLRPSPKSP